MASTIRVLSQLDGAGLFDVIEHLDDPAGALAAALQCVRPGGLLVGTVPAIMGRWSHLDVASGHKTRYSKRRLAALLRSVAGARVLEVAYFNRVLIPLFWVRRLVVRNSRVLDTTPMPGPSLWFSLQRLR